MQLEFSIGIPAFKAKFLKECIESILNQSIKCFELIIINDNSPDDLESIIRSFDDSRINYSKNEKNIGAENVVDNWNFCLNKAQGKFFLLMGDDDVLNPEYLHEFMELINRAPDLDVYHCRSLIIDEKSEPYGLTPSWPEYETIHENILHRVLNYRSSYISDFLYRTQTLKDRGGFYKLPLAWGSDELTSYIAMREKGIAHINKPLLYYRKSSYNISSIGNIDQKISAIIKEEMFYSTILNDESFEEENPLVTSIIKQNLSKHIRGKKAHAISNANIFSSIYRCFINKRKYKMSYKDMLYIIAKSFA